MLEHNRDFHLIGLFLFPIKSHGKLLVLKSDKNPIFFIKEEIEETGSKKKK